MGGGPNPYGPQYAQPVGADGKLVEGARPLWDSDWSDAMEQQALRTELNLSVSVVVKPISIPLCRLSE